MPEPHQQGNHWWQWRGKIDADLTNLSKSLELAHKNQDELEKVLNVLDKKVDRIATKIGVYASMGAIIGGALVQVFVGIFFKH